MRVFNAKPQQPAAVAAVLIAGLFAAPFSAGSALAQDVAAQDGAPAAIEITQKGVQKAKPAGSAVSEVPVVAYENPADSPLTAAAATDSAVIPEPSAADPAAGSSTTTAMNETPRQVPSADPAAAPSPEQAAAPQTSVNPIIAGVRTLLEADDKKRDRLDARDHEALKAFYTERQGDPVWVTANGWNARALAVKAEMENAADWGLDPSAFKFPALAAHTAPDELIERELSFAETVLLYARHARGGRIADPSKDLSSYLDRKPQLKSAKEVLERIAVASDPDAYLRGLNPSHPQFSKLREQLLGLRKGVAEREKVVEIPADGPYLRPGSSHPHVALIRERLGVAVPEIEGKDNPAEFYDDAMEAAIKTFQGENDLSQDGVVGTQTRAAFNGGNVVVSEEMLIANMEMWRWMPEDLGNVHVIAAIPEFRVSVFKSGREIHAERIIAGKTDKQTPVFSDEMETIVFHPFWGVPNSIKVNELLPTLARGGDLSRNGLRLQKNGRDVDPRSIDWSRDDIRSYHVYQPPGGGNVLGVVKFMFPNKHQVYMHDTPTKNLFNSKVRTYSHGCVRVRDPVKLAEVLLEADQGWPRSRVASLVNGGPQNNNVKLTSHIAVHTTYFTARVDENGELQTFRDIYGHEKRVRLALAGKWDQINKGRDHLAPVKIDRSRIKFAPKTDPVQDFFNSVFGF